MAANQLAKASGINVSEGMVMKFNNKDHTFLTKRFDRTTKSERIHFVSAMTLTGHVDGEDAAGASYLELVEFISRYVSNVDKDLEELWKRIVFSICIKNTDDHLRNHGFLLTNEGWVLSPAYGLKPNEYGTGLSLNISETDNALSLDLAMGVADYFRVTNDNAKKTIQKVLSAVKKWRKVATAYKIQNAEIQKM